MQIDSRSGALVLIDLMPRIIALDTSPRTGAEVRDRCLALADGARKAGALVVWVRVERPNVDEQPPGSGLDEACAPREDEPVVVKRAWSGFHETGLHALLTARGIETVAVAGLVTTFGVESTARTAADHGYRVVLPTDAMAAFSAEAHTFAEELVFPSIGTVCASDDVEWA
ncbi:cysteine hydrolase [Glycomyces sp. A-F 0318]|uniref:cysteine hydrolase family protein n=1 Tax=Glycomyces amatae TaxID=2881355 RepID=UPI001E4CAB01|nr:isochorismatase family cysteine hydrolase [Glycomyces amatae]MCD0447180.1 cysteine hydrolase [Glycomyces amatae]